MPQSTAIRHDPAVLSLAATVLNYRRGEGRLVALLVGLFFLKGVADVFFAASASTLYLQSFGAATLPYVYILSAIVVTLMGVVYSQLTERVATGRLLRMTLVAVGLSIATLHGLMWLAPSKWWAMGLMMWREVLYMLLNATLWAQVGALLNVRQGKRLFALIGTGEIVAASIAGSTIPFVVDRLGPLHLLTFCEISVALAIVLSMKLDVFARAMAARPARAEQPDRRSLATLMRDRYLALFFAVSVMSYGIYFVADFDFYDVVNRRFADPAVLASFFGAFYAVMNVLSLVLNGLVVGRLLTAYGIGVGLLALPAAVGMGALSTAAFPLLGLAPWVFWTAVGTKLVDEMLRGAFLYPTFKILYQPLPARERVRVQAVRDSLVEPIAVGLSGVLLLFLTRALGFTLTQLSLALLVLLAVFWMLSVALRDQYAAVLGKALSRRRSMDGASLLDNASSLAVLRRGVRNRNADESIYCLGLLEEADSKIAGRDLVDALGHGDPRVRAYVLTRLRARRAADTLGRVRPLVGGDASPDVCFQAASTVAELEDDAQAGLVLSDSDVACIRHGALVGLLHRTPIAPRAVDAVGSLARSLDVDERVTAARLIAMAWSTALDESLLLLLEDTKREVVLAALAAAGAAGSSAAVHAVLPRLSDASYRSAAAAALVSMGDVAVDPVAQAARDVIQRGDDDQIARRAIRILGRIGSSSAIGALAEHLRHPRVAIRGAVLDALSHARFAADARHGDTVRLALDEELASLEQISRCEAGIARQIRRTPLLAAALSHNVAEATDRMLLLLSFLYDRTTILDARVAFSHGSSDQRAQATEAIDTLLPREMALRVLPVLDDVGIPGRAARMSRAPAEEASGDLQVLEIVERPPAGVSSWSVACAIYEGARWLGARAAASVRVSASRGDALVRETAAEMLRSIERGASSSTPA